MPRPLDYSALQDRAADAGSLLGHRVFQEAVTELKADLSARLLALPIGDPRVIEMHAKAKLLDELVGELKSFVNDLRMAQKPSEA